MKAIIDRPVFLLLLLLGCVIGAMPSYAHPMGNFSVNHYSRITLTNDGIEIRYILDLAEIPTYQEMQDGTIVAKVDNPRVLAFIAERGEEFGRRLCLGIDGKLIHLRLISHDVIFPPGAGGLPTMKMGFTYRAAYPAGAGGAAVNLNFEDQNFDGHRGWKEIVVIAPQGMLIHASAPARDRSDELSNYPTDLLNSPPQDLNASIQFRLPSSTQPSALQGSNVVHSSTSAAGRISQVIAGDRKKTSSLATVPRHIPALQSSVRTATSVDPGRAIVIHAPPGAQTPTVIPAHLKTNQQATPRSAFTELITTTRVSFWFLIAAALTAFGLGALHALEPGHGKTIVAAYLVGSRGTARHAALLGIIVTVSHTAGVFALGAITLYASRYIVPERLYPWLGVSSGLLIAGLGGYMFLRRWAGEEDDHSHADGQPHSHWFAHKKSRPTLEGRPALQPTPVRGTDKSVSLMQLFVLGITGGIIPCPAALVVLLSALTLHRIGLGLFLIVAFSLGLAAVLVSFGMLMVYAWQFVTRFKVDGPFITQWLPLASAAFMTVLGAAITLQTLATTGLHIHLVSRAELGPFVFVVGFGTDSGCAALNRSGPCDRCLDHRKQAAEHTTRRIDRHILGTGSYANHLRCRIPDHTFRGSHSSASWTVDGIRRRAHADHSRRVEPVRAHAKVHGAGRQMAKHPENPSSACESEIGESHQVVDQTLRLCLRRLPLHATLVGWNCSRPGRLRRRCTSGVVDHSQPRVGHRLFAHFWRWDHAGHDVHDDSLSSSSCVCRQSLRAGEPVSRPCVWGAKPEFRSFSGLSARISRWTLHQPPALDTAIVISKVAGRTKGGSVEAVRAAR